MPFVNLNSLPSSGNAGSTPVDPASTTTASDTALPPLPGETNVPLPTLPVQSTAPVAAEVLPELPAPVTPAAVVPQPVETIMEAPVLAEPEAVAAPAESIDETKPRPGTIEFDMPTPTVAAVAPVVPAPATEIQDPLEQRVEAIEAAQAEIVTEEMPAEVQPALDATVAQPVPVSIPTPTPIPEPVTEPEPIVEIVPAAPAPAVEADQPADVTVTPAPTPVTELSTTLDQEQVLSFNSSPDADDADKPEVVKSPAIVVPEGVEIKSEQGGIREVVGPDFVQTTPTPLEQITTQNIDEKLTSLGNLMKPVPESSTAPVPATAPVDMTAPSETASVQVPVETPAAVTQEVVSVTEAAPEIMTDGPVTMAADPLDLTAISPVPTATPMAEVVQAAAADLLPAKTYDLNELLVEAIGMRASDLHLTVGYRAMARVDGKLTPIKSNILDAETIKAMVAQVVKDRKIEDPAQIRDYDLSYSLPDGSARFRVNIFRQQETLGLVLRLIPARIQSIESLKLPPVIMEFTKFSSGLVLFTGPTGSGKSTTIASLLNEINMNEPKHIVTVEDPIEYVYPKGVALVDQREIYTDTDSWQEALRSVLRQDPDVVLIGEMRDLETISSAIRVAETGHLVFATLHTNSAAQSIDRIIDVFPEGQQTQIRTQLASVIQAIVAQRLVPISGGGRRVATEILVATPAVRNAIRDDKVYQIDNMIQTSAELGMIAMEKSLVSLVREGLISTEQAQAYSNKPTDILTLLGQNR